MSARRSISGFHVSQAVAGGTICALIALYAISLNLKPVSEWRARQLSTSKSVTAYRPKRNFLEAYTLDRTSCVVDKDPMTLDTIWSTTSDIHMPP